MIRNAVPGDAGQICEIYNYYIENTVITFEENLINTEEMALRIADTIPDLPNEPSRRLHERLGFEPVAVFRETGFKFGKWIDVGYWELVL